MYTAYVAELIAIIKQLSKVLAITRLSKRRGLQNVSMAGNVPLSDRRWTCSVRQ